VTIPNQPDITITITPPGGSPTDYSNYLAWGEANQQMTITQNFGRQGDTACLTLVEEHASTPAVYIPVMSQVSLNDLTAGVNLFAGVINDPILCVDSPNLNEWDLNCTDYTFYADNAIVHGIFYGFTADQIIISLVQQADCGVTAVSTADGGFVAPGPQIAAYVLNYNPLSTAWRQLATLAGSATPYGWYVDENLELHFFDSSTAQSSGVTFTTNPTVGLSTTQGHIKLDTQFQYEWDGTSVENKILVQGANQTVSGGSPSTSNPTDEWKADGSQSAWPLRYTVSGTPTLEINGVSTTVVVASSGSTATGPWVVEQNSIGQYFLVAETAPSAGTSIKTWYTYLVPVVAQATDYASIATYVGPNGGDFGRYISDSSLTTVPMALARAQQTRTEYAFAVERTVFDTTEDFLGYVRAGQTCVINNQLVYNVQTGEWGVNDTFIMISNTVTFTLGGYRSMNPTCVRL
jgi:hypothetical protein